MPKRERDKPRQGAVASILGLFRGLSQGLIKSYGRGGGVGRALGVGATLGVGVTLGVEVGVAVAVGVKVGVGVGVTQPVSVYCWLSLVPVPGAELPATA